MSVRLAPLALLLVLAGCEGHREHVSQAPPPRGAMTYTRRCSSCHKDDGNGVGNAWPPLSASPWVVRDHETAIRAVLLGVRGPMQIAGRTFDGSMPNQGIIMTDAEIADVLTYARSSWGNSADAIGEAEVATIRASLAARTTAWTIDELEALRPH